MYLKLPQRLRVRFGKERHADCPLQDNRQLFEHGRRFGLVAEKGQHHAAGFGRFHHEAFHRVAVHLYKKMKGERRKKED